MSHLAFLALVCFLSGSHFLRCDTWLRNNLVLLALLRNLDLRVCQIVTLVSVPANLPTVVCSARLSLLVCRCAIFGLRCLLLSRDATLEMRFTVIAGKCRLPLLVLLLILSLSELCIKLLFCRVLRVGKTLKGGSTY